MESTLSLGMCCGAIGMAFGHEMIHRHSRFERLLAEIVMTSMTYPQLCIEHLHGHHRHYGKRDDYATARFGESYYQAVFRGIRGSIATAWNIETTRLKRRHLGTFDPRNRMLRYLLVLVAIYTAIGHWFGVAGIVLFGGQSAISIGLLFATNYVEHYGLSRREIAPGVYESGGPHLSWDAPGRLTNVFTLHLPRHADHHRVMSRRYEFLEYLPGAPQLPLSYGFMMLLAFVPPLWRTIMDRRVVAWTQHVPVTHTPVP
jgi:alkane 1-monooxygenase